MGAKRGSRRRGGGDGENTLGAFISRQKTEIIDNWITSNNKPGTLNSMKKIKTYKLIIKNNNANTREDLWYSLRVTFMSIGDNNYELSTLGQENNYRDINNVQSLLSLKIIKVNEPIINIEYNHEDKTQDDISQDFQTLLQIKSNDPPRPNTPQPMTPPRVGTFPGDGGKRTVQTPRGKRIVRTGPRGGEYVMLEGKKTPLSRIPKH